MEGKLGRLKPVQDALGDVNDCVATRAVFDPGKKFERFLKKRADKKAAKFYDVWTGQFDAAGEEEAWIEYLAKAPISPPPVRADRSRSRRANSVTSKSS